jgi:very-short-patch-repair endonuclease
MSPAGGIYLTEALLGEFLRQRVDSDIVANQPVPGSGRRLRPDYQSEQWRLIVEFDGDAHYRQARTILGDAERDRFFVGLGYRVIRIPYFVQLTTAVIADLFGKAAEDQTDFLEFPHGFIADTVVMPSDFCELGIARFDADLSRFSYIRDELLQSLKAAWRLVCPPSRQDQWLGD